MIKPGHCVRWRWAGLFPRLISSLKSDTKRGRDMAPSLPTVFTSYSHDSPELEELVLRFAQRLRNDRVDAHIDQFVAAGRRKAGHVITVALYGLLPASWPPSYRQNWIAFRQRGRRLDLGHPRWVKTCRRTSMQCTLIDLRDLLGWSSLLNRASLHADRSVAWKSTGLNIYGVPSWI